MIDWLVDNKEWVFGGIGITLLSTIFYTIKKMFSKRKKEEQKYEIYLRRIRLIMKIKRVLNRHYKIIISSVLSLILIFTTTSIALMQKSILENQNKINMFDKRNEVLEAYIVVSDLFITCENYPQEIWYLRLIGETSLPEYIDGETCEELLKRIEYWREKALVLKYNKVLFKDNNILLASEMLSAALLDLVKYFEDLLYFKYLGYQFKMAGIDTNEVFEDANDQYAVYVEMNIFGDDDDKEYLKRNDLDSLEKINRYVYLDTLKRHGRTEKISYDNFIFYLEFHSKNHTDDTFQELINVGARFNNYGEFYEVKDKMEEEMIIDN